MLNNRLIIMQGAAASGKSTISNYIEEGILAIGYGSSEHLSTDNERYVKGIYTFDSKTDWQNHAKTKQKCELAMVRGVETIILDDTNILKRYAQTYLDLAEKYEYDVQVIRVSVPRDLALRQNNLREPDRRIPEEVIDKMMDTIEDLI